MGLDEEVNNHQHLSASTSSSVSRLDFLDVLISFSFQALLPPLIPVSHNSRLSRRSKSPLLMLTPAIPIPPSPPVPSLPKRKSLSQLSDQGACLVNQYLRSPVLQPCSCWLQSALWHLLRVCCYAIWICINCGSSLPRFHLGLSLCRLHRASSSLWLHLDQSSLCLCHRLPVLYMHLIPPSL